MLMTIIITSAGVVTLLAAAFIVREVVAELLRDNMMSWREAVFFGSVAGCLAAAGIASLVYAWL